MSELKKCPFCGGEARIKSRYIGYGSVGLGARDWYTVECNECRAKSDEYGAELEAIAAWNRRADARQLALKTRVCPMCEDCPDGCPVEAPNDSRNKPENEPLTLSELYDILRAQLTAEKRRADAAVEDIYRIASCDACKHYDADENACGKPFVESFKCFEWRGVKEEST